MHKLKCRGLSQDLFGIMNSKKIALTTVQRKLPPNGHFYGASIIAKIQSVGTTGLSNDFCLFLQEFSFTMG